VLTKGAEIMRRAFHGKVIYGKDFGYKRKKANIIVGVDLGADYCAEHEWGIKGISRRCGIGNYIDNKGNYVSASERDNFESYNGTLKPLFGIEARSIRDGSNVKIYEYKIKGEKAYALVCAGGYYDRNCNEKPHSELIPWEDDWDFSACWSGEDFAFMAKDKNVVETLYNAFQNLDITIGFTGGGVFKNAGLTILIKSLIPKSWADKVYENDKENYETWKEAYETGIYEELKNAGKKFFALSPKKDDKGNLIFWLNPQEQDKYNFGWVTLQDLKDWAQDKGKIVLKKGA